jgi:hypothetical protein
MLHVVAATVTLLGAILISTPASAHCDTTRGPVVTAARAALDAGDPTLVLHWVRADDEAAIKAAFQQALQVRALGPGARELADRHFFETLVRIHRAGEGAPYTGLTDAEPEPIIAAADRALERGSADELEQVLVSEVKAGLAERFAAARSAREFRRGDVAAGRGFVGTYVSLTHWVEGVLTAAKGAGEHHALAAGHDTASLSSAPVHHTEGHAERDGAAPAHGAKELQHLPWILAGLLAIAALVEGMFLLKRRHAEA